MQNIEIYKTLIATKFCTTIKTAKYSSWVVQVCIHQIQDGKQLPFEKHLKSQYLHSCFTKFDKIWHGDTMVHRADCTLMFRIFENGSGRCLKYNCGDAFPIEGVLVATYLLSVEALTHCRLGVANKSCMV